MLNSHRTRSLVTEPNMNRTNNSEIRETVAPIPAGAVVLSGGERGGELNWSRVNSSPSEIIYGIWMLYGFEANKRTPTQFVTELRSYGFKHDDLPLSPACDVAIDA